MLFHTFHSQEERRAYGGSAFLELQFCRLSANATIQELVAVDSIQNWKNDSLYISDENIFYDEYSQIFDCGTYNNLQTGTVDIYGINYYAPSVTAQIIEKLHAQKPMDYEVLLHWLSQSKPYNGFYILGI